MHPPPESMNSPAFVRISFGDNYASNVQFGIYIGEVNDRRWRSGDILNNLIQEVCKTPVKTASVTTLSVDNMVVIMTNFGLFLGLYYSSTHPSPSLSSSDADVVCPSASGVKGLEADSVLTGCSHAFMLLVLARRALTLSDYYNTYEAPLTIRYQNCCKNSMKFLCVLS